MTAEVSAVSESLLAVQGALPLRQDDPLSLLFICKTLGVLVLLLLLAYLALRWYASRYSNRSGTAKPKKMQCIQELRLSVKTRAYLLDIEGQSVLVIDANSGVSTLQIERPPSPPGS